MYFFSLYSNLFLKSSHKCYNTIQYEQILIRYLNIKLRMCLDMFRIYHSFFFIDCLFRQIWRFWKWKYFDSQIFYDRKFYFPFCSLQPEWNILQVKFSLQVLYLFKTWVTWSHFPIQNEMKLLPWQTECLHSSKKNTFTAPFWIVLPANIGDILKP